MLTIYKASAGSGKTFRLVVEYLKLVLADPQAFRHILAVTFTNKATAEMKERILEHLGRMANDRASGYMEKIMEEVGYPEGEIRERASRALGQILFDYDRFAVSTIDKFTQRVLRAFNKELGINPAYQIETDSALLVAEAADRLIAGVGENKGLFHWLESFIREKIGNNRSFAIEKDLLDLGGELFRERLQGRLGLLT
ncbi:MAG: UvrD-helicase domain-containing protein, partial [Prolixibacteraceae bacterium]|nr:UvrD-helicase domain-containing protein [Prolixibacteraceae bacterium]